MRKAKKKESWKWKMYATFLTRKEPAAYHIAAINGAGGSKITRG